jgi:uncharacterized membrane protein YdjX (TVP38/TMEM64 family)
MGDGVTPESANEGKDKRKLFRVSSWILILSSVVLTIGIAVLAVIFRKEVANFQQYGYLGAFLVSLMAGATIILYIPGIPVIFALGGVLPSPLFVGLAAGIGEAIGELTGYSFGRGGATFLKEKYIKIYSRMEKWLKTRGYLTIFLASAIFNPFFDVVGATAGALRYPLWKFFLWCWAGKTVKGIAVAYLGRLGLRYILHWVNIPT